MNLRSSYLGFALWAFSSSPFAQTLSPMDYVQAIAGENGIGARLAGTEADQLTAEYIEQQWLNQGLSPYTSSFKIKNESLSKNVIVDIKGKSDKTLIIAAHYDSIGAKEGSLGAADNASSIAALLVLSHNLRNQNLAVNIRLIAFGAEEIGLLGSQAYVRQLSAEEIDTLVGMINLDTIVGGDNLYIHSAHVKPYDCAGTNKPYSNDATLRDQLLAQAQRSFTPNPFSKHPAFPGYPEGMTGGWSDHAPFACAGVPIAYIEATNFSINGKDGYDGYSQSTNPALWDCFSEQELSACDRNKETKWGDIWHTEYDRLDKLIPLFGKRLELQLAQNIQLLTEFVETYQPPIKR
jgi:Zn-dependent M28 family amino/carboxypeptidase